MGFHGGSASKETACNIQSLGLGRSSGEGNGYPLQYYGLENPVDCRVHGAAKSRTRLSDFHFHLSIYCVAEFYTYYLHSFLKFI